MALIVEDGTGLATAEAYISVADADLYFDDYGSSTNWDLIGIDSVKEDALRQGAQHIDFKDYMGIKLLGTQALSWPRSGMEVDGYTVEGIPEDLKRANAEFALQYADIFVLSDDASSSDVTRERVEVVGQVLSDFSYSGGGGKSAGKTFPKGDSLLRKYLGGDTAIRG